MWNTSWLEVFTFFGIWAVVWLPIALIVSQKIDWQPDRVLEPQQKLALLGSLYILAPIIIGWKIKANNLSFADLGLSFDLDIFISLVWGLILALASLFLVFVLESVFNLVSWQFSNLKQLSSAFLLILILSLSISLVEESIFRGYIFSTLLKGNSYWLSAIASSIIFALLHLIWERKETFPQLPGLWLMGMILLGARLVDNNSIGLAIGLHAGWIWGLTCIDSAQLLIYHDNDSWLTGINQQPLAGVAGISCLIFTGLVMLVISPQLLF